MWRMRSPSLDRVGTVALIAITLLTLATLVTASVFRSMADDLYTQVAEAQALPGEHARTTYGAWLSAHLASDLDSGDLVAMQARAQQLANRSDRLREFTGVQGLIGLLVAMVTGRPAFARDWRHDASQPAANTASNGTA